VFSTDIVDGQVKTADLAGSAVTNSKVATNAVTAGKIAASAVTADKIATSAVTAGKIASNAVSSGKVANESLTGVDVKNGSLKDEDVGKVSLVRFEATIGFLPAHNCRRDAITGLPVKADHMLLTPDDNDALTDYTYSIRYDFPDPFGNQNIAYLQTCNVGNFDHNTSHTHFNLLAFDAG
jgi:hypothetical protein